MTKPAHKSTKSYLRIGQIAQRTGVSAKALRLYEQRGLLQPCAHTEGGYRLYGPAALRRLMQILLLKRSGFTLAQIGALAASKATVIANLLGERIAALQRELADKTRALRTLQTVANRVGSASALDLDQLLESISMTNTLELHLSPALRERAEKFAALIPADERERWRQRVDQRVAELGPAGLEDAQRPWRELSADIRAAMDAGRLASDPLVIALAGQWQAQVGVLLAQDPDFLSKLRDLYTRHPELMAEQSMSPAMMDYMDEAMRAAGMQSA